jgi:predicted Fe-S protein YdhL (DUF1289 family)
MAAIREAVMAGSVVTNGGDEPLPSPCIGLCRMDPLSGLCQGCLRTIDEIVQWGQADEAFKRSVWLAIAQRERSVDLD